VEVTGLRFQVTSPHGLDEVGDRAGSEAIRPCSSRCRIDGSHIPKAEMRHVSDLIAPTLVKALTVD